MQAPETEVLVKATRRNFSAEYKRRILEEADQCTKPGELGALLRREGLYSSHLVDWRRARKRGELEGLAPKKRGPKVHPVDERDREIAELRRQVERLSDKLEKAELIIELQKKLGQLLGVEMPPDPRSTERK